MNKRVTKPGWAERKVNAVWKRHGGLLSGDDMVRLLRAERARAIVAKDAGIDEAMLDAEGYTPLVNAIAAALEAECESCANVADKQKKHCIFSKQIAAAIRRRAG